MRAIRALRPTLVIALTSYIAENPGDEARASGAAGFIGKPYHDQEFLAEIARVPE